MAQENNRTKYEEPIPLTELTSDTIYVQGRKGFSAMKIPDGHSSKKKREKSSGSYSHPVRVAIMVQKVWKCTGFIYQGLLGGIAFMHFILVSGFDSKPLYLIFAVQIINVHLPDIKYQSNYKLFFLDPNIL